MIMNYRLHYEKLIERSRSRKIDGYTEKHHIVPRCLGGTDEKVNIAILTPEEHFVAHQLLIKLYPGNRDLIYAAQLMTTHHTEARSKNKLFGWLRRQCATAMSAQTKKWIEENGHPKGMKGKTHSLDTKRRVAATAKESMTQKKGVKVYVYDLDGRFEQEYRTLTDCADAIGAKPINVKSTAEGKFTHCKGKQISYLFVESMPPRKSRLLGVKKQQVACPHCTKRGGISGMKRYHFDNCKFRGKTEAP